MSKSLEKLRKEGEQVFGAIFGAKSDVRHLSEARRENSAAEYASEKMDEAFEAMLDASLEQSKQVYGDFAKQPLD